MMKKKYEFSVLIQQRHLKAIVEVTAQALPSGHGSGLLAEGLALQEGCRSGL